MDASAPVPADTHTDRSRLFAGVGWTLFALACFLTMIVSTREIRHINVFEILVFRCVIGLAVLLPWNAYHGLGRMRTTNLRLHIIRNVIHIGGQSAWIYAVIMLPLALVTALEFTVPLLVGVIAPLLVKEHVSVRRWLVLVAGFIGVVVMLRPGAGTVDAAVFIMMAGAVCYAIAGTLVKSLSRADSPAHVVFYMSLLQLPICLFIALFFWTTPNWTDIPWILGFGLAGLAAHYGMAKALSLIDLAIVYPLDFLRLPFVALMGYSLYQERVSPWTILGACVIIGANYYGVRHESRRSKTAVSA
jgi:drug/metabolite transporter (DMT)-like permease